MSGNWRRRDQQQDRESQREEEERIRQSRELNPHLKSRHLDDDRYSSKPTSSSTDGGAGWLRRALKRAEEQAESEGRSVEEIAAERWGSLEKLMSMIAAAEGKASSSSAQGLSKNSSAESSSRREQHHRSREEHHRSREDHHRSHDHGEKSEKSFPTIADLANKQRTFLSPNDYLRREKQTEETGELVRAKPLSAKLARRMGDGWKSKDFVSTKPIAAEMVESSSSSEAEEEERKNEDSKAVPTIDDSTFPFPGETDLNKLNAQLVKAELKLGILDNAKTRDFITNLKTQIDAVKSGEYCGTKTVAGASNSNDILLMRTDPKTGQIRPLKFSSGGEALRDLIEEEKRTTADDQDLVFAEMTAKAAKQKLSEDYTVDDVIEGEHAKKRKRGKKDREEKHRDRQRKEAIEEHKRHEQSISDCAFCIDSRKMQKHLIVAMGLKTYLCVPLRQSLVDGHCLIVPMTHVTSSTQLDEDVWEEMKIWRKGLVAMFRTRDEDCVFIETALRNRQHDHMAIECIPLPAEIGETAPIYFKKAILECDVEWAQNKKLVELKGRDIRRAVPKGFAYFAVDFGLESGYAHVIEDDTKFPTYFGTEILGGMLDLDDYNLWRKPRTEEFDAQLKKKTKLAEEWKPFDWTERVKSALKD